ncbi:MAG: nucleotide exchange factor GrpE [Bacteroidota bacterium]|nr:nucleotide exchange factor GrpE [Bacteroidota bacterium]
MNTEEVNDPEVNEVHEDASSQQAAQEEQVEAPEGAEAATSELDSSADESATDWQDKYLRLYAEFDNFRKRTMRERGDLIRNASMDVLEKLLPILDDFDRAAANPSDDAEATREGQALIHTKLRQSLEAQGLAKMEVNPGDAFDVDLHEAITNIPAPTPELAGKVVDVVEPGYKLNDKIMRYAKVVVGQ